jgi:hypothetical protein
MIMATKLTLSLDEDIIRFAHDYSHKNATSISRLFERFLSRLKANEEQGSSEGATNQGTRFHAKTQRLLGAYRTNPIPDKKELREVFYEKSAR